MDKEVRKYLIELSRIKRTVAYGTAMNQFNYDVAHHNQIDLFADIIGDISIYEHEYDRPMLSSLVIHASGRSIGKGFYRLAEQLGYGDKELLLKQNFEREMQIRCYDYWRDNDNYRKNLNGDNTTQLENSFLTKNNSFPEGFTTPPGRKPTFAGFDTDWDRKHSDDKLCGDLGEELVIKYEKSVLENMGHSDWAQEVIKVKDGNGYDIFSRDEFGNPKFIEVKTTVSEKETPFSISINEVIFSEQNADSYYLYRLYNLNIITKTAEFNEYRGKIKDIFFLEAIQFDAFKKIKHN